MLEGFYGVIFKDGSDYKRYGKFLLGGGFTLGLDTAVTVTAIPYPVVTFMPVLNGNTMAYDSFNENGYVFTDANGGDTSVFTCTAKSDELDGIGLAVY